jgi:DNA-binding beta-propeller fold protein YncE
MNQQVRMVDLATGIITVVAGVAGETGSDDGPVSCPPLTPLCTPARLNNPLGVAVDIFGTVYVADEGNDKIRMVPGEGHQVQTVETGPLDSPSGVAAYSDEGGVILYIADTNNHRIQSVFGEVVATVAGTGTAGDGPDGPATAAQLNTPVGIAIDSTGRFLYIADLINNKIRQVDLTPDVIP